MRLRIAICDDEKNETEYLAHLTSLWAASFKIGAEISVYDSAEAFLFAYNGDNSFDILLLDIQMKQIDGVTLAKRLRADGFDMQIVFVTGLPDFIAEGYEVSALHYLMKPVGEDKLFAVLDKAVRLLEKADEMLLVDTDEGRTRLPIRDVLYVEAFAHKTTICTINGELAARAPIGELESALGSEFFRVHRSYLVGLRHIRQITKDTVLMDDGRGIPLSRRRYDEVNRAFIEYYRGLRI